MPLLEVTTPALIREFLELPTRLYVNHPHWIRPLDQDIEQVFDPRRNPNFQNGKIIRWVLQNAHGQTIGRVAAFVNDKTKAASEYLTGGMGFFECINDQAAAFQLFDACQSWLEAQGMEAMDGPINFGERDRWWGLLVDGFTEPNYGMFYHAPYYKELFEAYGFQVYFKQYTYKRSTTAPLHPKIIERSAVLGQDPNYRVAHASKKNLEKLAQDFLEVYNKAWGGHSGVNFLTLEKVRKLMKTMKPVMDERLLFFTYYKEQPIAFFILLPELNQIFKHLNGRFDWWGKLKFLYYKWRNSFRKDKRLFGLIFGVVPEFQGKGVDAFMMNHSHQTIMDYAPELEMNWVGDFNPKMMMVTRMLGAVIYKTHITYRKIFDPSKPFTRYPIIK
ncbi:MULTISPECIES: hypothetical protein [Rufibacter]|uniref:GNAT superfamily N-acetyltransferase n=1 Tax=Rufibacter quisquiliarum TaxID=1549639 RepID=A0A839GL02_9BACT|nr:MULTISPECIES: hypothetical protein [Rufibacter]MBA9078483.1 GNAT superfamily N-acetyltransferase [Rufibacter quisquiliarum]